MTGEVEEGSEEGELEERVGKEAVIDNISFGAYSLRHKRNNSDCLKAEITPLFGAWLARAGFPPAVVEREMGSVAPSFTSRCTVARLAL